MPARKKKLDPPKRPAQRNGCVCGGDCFANDAHLPGYLLIGFGLIALPVNFGLISGMEWARAWPLFLVLLGAVLLAKNSICASKS